MSNSIRKTPNVKCETARAQKVKAAHGFNRGIDEQ